MSTTTAEDCTTLSVAVIGVGGYGATYASSLLDAPEGSPLRFVGAIDPAAQASRCYADIQARGIPVFDTPEAFFAAGGRADLVVVSSPIAFHARQTCLALEHGCHVLCEKPLCASVDDVRRMIAARNRAGRQVAIGYQWSYAAAIHSLKADIQSGRLGQPRRLSSLNLWPRDEVYYGRNRWVGAQYDAAGNPVFDSPVNNACAHHLHNMFYVLGDRTDTSAMPVRVTAELYRANKIQNYDTASLRCITADGVEVLFHVSHAIGCERKTAFCYEFENATVSYDDLQNDIIARFTDGTTKHYGSPDTVRRDKLPIVAAAIRSGTPVPCGIEAAAAQTLAMLAAQRSPIVDFPADLIRVKGDPGSRVTYVEGLDAILRICYEMGRLPGEVRATWARRADEQPVASL